jgi:hypothetical protein
LLDSQQQSAAATSQNSIVDTALLFQQAAQQALTGQQLSAVVSAAASNLMVPSPSLPNLPTTATIGGTNEKGGPIENAVGATLGSQQDLMNLMALQNTFMHFLSMPSLLKSPLHPPNSMFDSPQALADSTSSSTSSGLLKNLHQ